MVSGCTSVPDEWYTMIIYSANVTSLPRMYDLIKEQGRKREELEREKEREREREGGAGEGMKAGEGRQAGGWWILRRRRY